MTIPPAQFDCNDLDPMVNPAATEILCDGAPHGGNDFIGDQDCKSFDPLNLPMGTYNYNNRNWGGSIYMAGFLVDDPTVALGYLQMSDKQYFHLEATVTSYKLHDFIPTAYGPGHRYVTLPVIMRIDESTNIIETFILSGDASTSADVDVLTAWDQTYTPTPYSSYSSYNGETQLKWSVDTSRSSTVGWFDKSGSSPARYAGEILYWNASGSSHWRYSPDEYTLDDNVGPDGVEALHFDDFWDVGDPVYDWLKDQYESGNADLGITAIGVGNFQGIEIDCHDATRTSWSW